MELVDLLFEFVGFVRSGPARGRFVLVGVGDLGESGSGGGSSNEGRGGVGRMVFFGRFENAQARGYGGGLGD